MIYYEDDGVRFEYHENFGEVFLHCLVFKWSPSRFKKYIYLFGEFLNKMEESGYERLVTITPNPKFAEIFGGKYLKDIEYEGTTYEAFVWELKQ